MPCSAGDSETQAVTSHIRHMSLSHSITDSSWVVRNNRSCRKISQFSELTALIFNLDISTLHYSQLFYSMLPYIARMMDL